MNHTWIRHDLPIKINRVALHKRNRLHNRIRYAQKPPVKLNKIVRPCKALQHLLIEKQHDSFLNPDTKDTPSVRSHLKHGILKTN